MLAGHPSPGDDPTSEEGRTQLAASHSHTQAGLHAERGHLEVRVLVKKKKKSSTVFRV